jgi:predicted alpha/beta hydrolase family esterase
VAARLAGLLFAFILPLVVVLIVIASFQSNLIFPVGAVPQVAMPHGARPLETLAADGKSRLRGLHIAPQSAGEHSQLILGFGGNGWNAVHTAQTLHQLYPDDHVVVFFYRGYAPSEGQAASIALLADAPLVYDAAVSETGAQRPILAGFSIGSGVAATLATKRPVAGLILVTPFDRLGLVAGDMFPWLPVSLVFAHEIDAAAALSTIDAPTVMIAAANDEIISAARTDGLRAVATSVVLDQLVGNVGHNDIYGSAEFAIAMRKGRALIAQGGSRR